ncbi:hypothetical protein DQ04_06701020 [Trypanosoma grayi]|uniref:hypothetical protein n=1 Tax=Trypanosoma grayi TaxID=71804 RepID=UPI0004F494C9|nr:hypothetical protein DQ04_06701020 [Trypanosoma grayi]KEG08657.1 hypothetical protein DQ04_06701020 [Trypanosoma grayi]
MSLSRKTSPVDELRKALDAKVCKWGALELGHGSGGHNSVFSLTDYDYPDRHLLRSFCTTPALQWSSFSCMQKGNVAPSEAQARGVAEDFAKLTSLSSTGTTGSQNIIAESVSSVSAFLEECCPKLCPKKGEKLHRGSTFLLFAVITGDTELARRCLELGANPNSMGFLSDPDGPVNQMQHGYSPMFISVIVGKVEVMSVVHHFGGSIHVYDRWGRTPFNAAVALGDTEIVQWLLAKGAPRCIGNCMSLQPDASTFPEMTSLNPALHRRPELCNNEEEAPLCHCHSGRPKGFCGCVDDMFSRWSYDRLRSPWHAGMDFNALATAYAASARTRRCVG